MFVIDVVFRSRKHWDHSMSVNGGSGDNGDADMMTTTHDRSHL